MPNGMWILAELDGEVYYLCMNCHKLQRNACMRCQVCGQQMGGVLVYQNRYLPLNDAVILAEEGSYSVE